MAKKSVTNIDKITLETSAGWWGDIYVWACGGIVTVTTGAVFFAKNAVSSTVAKLPEGYRPPHEICGADNVASWAIAPDGRIEMNPEFDRARRSLAVSFAAEKPEETIEERPAPKKTTRSSAQKSNAKGEPDEE